MTSAWIQHVKMTQQEKGISYKEAMSVAKASYNPTSSKKKKGGSVASFVKKVNVMERKGRNTLKTAERKGINTLDRTSQIIDKGKVIGRKARNTVSKVITEASPLVALASPELAIGMQALNKSIGGRLGSKNNKYLNGGSFKVQGGSVKSHNHANCPTCGGGIGSFGRASSSVLSNSHNSFAPLKPKSYTERLKTN